MISKKMVKALNKQLNFELYSAYVYLAMAANSNTMGLKGFSNWFHVQFQEELFHADRFYNYILDQDGEVELEQIEKPKKEYKDAYELFDETLTHEREVTKRIYELASLALEEKDHGTHSWLQWFITEQQEEEANVKDIKDKLKLAGSTGQGLFMINAELATRVYVQPTVPGSQA
ncbi:ferritin [Seleniivibrio sp.]|uniref:ferritin n=1 Tax=Seleniivibrio sp. TaxID=2898801 RepID=UPI0025E1A69B|nr:ferritin [Seleniivibrio sp.]MCD8553546.1 ferritin [Seleniivibrio sp.]